MKSAVANLDKHLLGKTLSRALNHKPLVVRKIKQQLIHAQRAADSTPLHAKTSMNGSLLIARHLHEFMS